MPAVFEASREQSADKERVNAGAKAGPCWIGGRRRPTRGHYTCTYEYGKVARCSNDHRHITAQELSDPSVVVVMEGDPALVEGEIKGWRLSGRFARSDIAYCPILFGGCAEVVLGDRQ